MIALRRRRRSPSPGVQAGLISPAEWRRASTRLGVGSAQVLLLVALVVIGLGPILWLAKSAITPTNDTISHPMSLFPHGAAWGNLSEAWSNVQHEASPLFVPRMCRSTNGQLE